MAIPHAGPCVPVDLKGPVEQGAGIQSSALVKNEDFEALRVAIPKGHEVCRHRQMEGPITVQCLDGQIAFNADGNTHTIRAGQWTYLPGGVPHSITGIEDSLILLTVIFRKEK